VRQHVLAVVSLEMAVMRLMKVDQDGHDFTDRQRSFSMALDNSTREQMLLQGGQKSLAKIIDTYEYFK
jgi:hypothetical protein